MPIPTNAWYLSRNKSSSITSPSDTISEQSLADATKEVINQFLSGSGGTINSKFQNSIETKDEDAHKHAHSANSIGSTSNSNFVYNDNTGNNYDSSSSSSSSPPPPPEISFLFPTITKIPHFLINSLPKYIQRITYFYPPVGITTIYILFQFFFSKEQNLLSRVLNVIDNPNNDDDDMNNKIMRQRRTLTSRSREKRIGRKLELDESDGKMMIGLGGVESVRAELCIAALEDYIISEDDVSQEEVVKEKEESSTPSNSTSSSSEIPRKNNNGQQSARKNWNRLDNPEVLSYYAKAARDVLQINAPPMSSREDFVEKTIKPLVKLEHYDRIRKDYYQSFTNVRQQQVLYQQARFKKPSSSIPSFTSSLQSKSASSTATTTSSKHTDNSKIIDIIWMSSNVAQIRTTDALLRTLRDRLVISAMRLSRKEKYRVWRLQWYENGFLFLGRRRGWYVKQWMRKTMKDKTIDDDRRNLQLTRAALKRELERLGQVQELLLNRPCEMSETRLLNSLQVTVDDRHFGSSWFQRSASSSTSSTSSTSSSTSTKGTPIDSVSSTKVSNHNADGPRSSSSSIKSTLRPSSNKAGHIHGSAARQTLLRPECDNNRRNSFKPNHTSRRPERIDESLNSLQQWTLEAQEWSMKGRSVIAELVTETISDVFDPDSCLTRGRNSRVEDDLITLSDWASGKKSGEEDWYTVLILFDCLSKARLMREHKYLPRAIDLKYWFKSLDFFGIPSSLATIGVSWVVHNIFKPYWPDIVKGAKVVGKTTWGVIEFRFVNPLKDITLDLLNHRPKLLDPFELSNEETSLDNMLRDLGIGDGTKAGRKEAVATASRMYESEMAQGVLRNFFRGEMVRLLLIQVQQLKTGLLQAMGSIDDLIHANSLSVQLFATIPAILLVTFGTRIFFRALYGLRSKDIVGLPTAHAEMKSLLMKMERCLLLSSHTDDSILDTNREIFLKPYELGEFVLYMHSYLGILDFCSPPFPTKTCDAIHSEMQELLMQGRLSTKRQIALLKLIGEKHDDLLKSI